MPHPPLPLRDLIAGHIRRDIIRGYIPAGARIREEEVAQRFGVSRVPIREAIRRLETEGFVTLTPHRGATVTIPSVETGLELLQIRRALETLAAGLAAERRGDPVAGELTQLTHDAQRQLVIGDISRHAANVERFHKLVAEAAGNAELELLLTATRRKLRWVFSIDVEHRAHNSWTEHTAILESILSGDAHRARQTMDDHVAADALVLQRQATEAAATTSG